MVTIVSCSLCGQQEFQSEFPELGDHETAQVASDGPAMTFDKRFVEMGEVKKGEKTVHLF